MNRTVWKFSIPIYSQVEATFEIPEGAELVHAGAELHPERLSLWFEVDSEAPNESRRFEIFGTGHQVSGTYAGTAILPPLVVHAYEQELE